MCINKNRKKSKSVRHFPPPNLDQRITGFFSKHLACAQDESESTKHLQKTSATSRLCSSNASWNISTLRTVTVCVEHVADWNPHAWLNPTCFSMQQPCPMDAVVCLKRLPRVLLSKEVWAYLKLLEKLHKTPPPLGWTAILRGMPSSVLTAEICSRERKKTHTHAHTHIHI
jgi:hypothetical protein